MAVVRPLLTTMGALVVLAVLGALGRRWGRVGLGLVAAAAGSALVVLVGGPVLATRPVALLWLALPVLVLVAAHQVVRRDRTEAWAALGLGTLAAVARGLAQHLPANWYVDLHGPWSAEPAYLQRDVGFAGFFAYLDAVVPLGASFLFVWNVACSALAVSLLVSACWRENDPEDRRSDRPRGSAVCLGLLLALDPLQVALGASDATHSTALLAFALGLWWYREISRGAALGANAAASWRGQACLYACVALAGLTRPELSYVALVYPVLVPSTGAERRTRTARVSAGVVATAVLVAVLFWSRLDVGVAIRAVTMDRLRFFLTHLAPPFLRADPGSCPWPWDARFRDVLLGLSAAWLVRVAVVRVWRALWIIPGYVLLMLPRVASDFNRAPFCENLAALRYDVVLGVVVMSVAAAGGAAVLEALAWLGARIPIRIRRPARIVAVLGLGGGVVGWVAQTATWDPGPYCYRREFAFLRAAIGLLPPGSTVALHWSRLMPGAPFALDTGLGLPHAALSFERRDLHWLLLGPRDALPAARPLYYYHGAVCGLDPRDFAAKGAAGAADGVEQLRTACSEAKSRVGTWLIERDEPVRTIFWRLEKDRLQLGIGEIP